jgi:hypothetical protein
MKSQLKSALLGALISVVIFLGSAFINKTQEAEQYVQVIVLESHIRGGLGRSRLIITYPEGTKEELELSNYQSMTGINFANVTGNEKSIVTTLNKLGAQGYQLKWLESGVSEGIYVTKYVFKK